MSKVYLCGPITGLSYDNATDWRDYAIEWLKPYGIEALSPLRFKTYLQGIEDLQGHHDEYASAGVLSSGRGIMTRDRFDATRADMVLANFNGAEKISAGSVMELAWADLKRIPIVAVMPDGNVHDHAMIKEAIGFRVDTLEKALEVVKAVLYTGPELIIDDPMGNSAEWPTALEVIGLGSKR